MEESKEFSENKFPFLKNVHRGFCSVETSHGMSLQDILFFVRLRKNAKCEVKSIFQFFQSDLLS
jgi:hypothetical protein